MGAAISQSVKSQLETKTLEELLSDDEYVKGLQELSSGLADNARKNLMMLSQKRHADSPAASPAKRPAKVVQSTIARKLTQKNLPKVAAAGTSATTLGAVTALSMMSGTASPKALSDATPGEDKRIGRVWKIKKEEVSLPPEIAGSFEMWKADPSAFLRNGSLQIPSSPREYYDYTLSLRDSIAINRVRWRFITTAYHDVISDLSRSSRYTITKEAVDFVVAVVCPSSFLDRQTEAKNNIVIWAKEGAKYRALADAIGGTWCYFFLPSIGESNWTKVLTGNEIKAAGKLLVDLGIHEEAQRLDAVELAGTIATILRKPFESIVPFQAHGQMIPSNLLQKATNGARAVDAYENTAESQIYEASIPDRQWSVREAGTSPYTISPFEHRIHSSETLVPEMLHNITVYFENMLPDHLGALLTPKGAKLCSDFDSYCFTATMLIAKGPADKFSYSIFQATVLLNQILLAEHPRTLACFFEVFIHFIRTRLPDATTYFCRQIKCLSAQLFPREHPWGRICCLLGELDSDSLDETLAQAWRCTADIFDRKLGPLEPLAVSFRLDYIKRVFGTTDDLKEEQLLRDLLARFKEDLTISTPRVMLNLAHNLKRQQRHDEAEIMALEVTKLLGKHEMYAQRVVERIESLKIISHIQYEQGTPLAEQTMRRAIQMVVDHWGKQHSWVFEFKTVLHSWLQSWGREPDAKTLWGEIEEFMRENNISE
ncbi:hypothetical protein PtrEW13061_010701 [Pyrenophora tritici-repentis]|nr:hypothetical protein PtrEW13061_010701 [Pyrenophora tritici-repentis]